MTDFEQFLTAITGCLKLLTKPESYKLLNIILTHVISLQEPDESSSALPDNVESASDDPQGSSFCQGPDSSSSLPQTSEVLPDPSRP